MSLPLATQTTPHYPAGSLQLESAGHTAIAHSLVGFFLPFSSLLFPKMLPNIAIGVLRPGWSNLLQAPLPAQPGRMAVGYIAAHTHQAPDLLTAIPIRLHHLTHRGETAPVVLPIEPCSIALAQQYPAIGKCSSLLAREHTLLNPDMDQGPRDLQLTRRFGKPNPSIAALSDTCWVERTGRRNLVLFTNRLHAPVCPLFTSLRADALGIQRLSDLVVGHVLGQFTDPCHERCIRHTVPAERRTGHYVAGRDSTVPQHRDIRSAACIRSYCDCHFLDRQPQQPFAVGRCRG